jgi:hypothetical protein
MDRIFVQKFYIFGHDQITVHLNFRTAHWRIYLFNSNFAWYLVNFVHADGDWKNTENEILNPTKEKNQGIFSLCTEISKK